MSSTAPLSEAPGANTLSHARVPLIMSSALVSGRLTRKKPLVQEDPGPHRNARRSKFLGTTVFLLCDPCTCMRQTK